MSFTKQRHGPLRAKVIEFKVDTLGPVTTRVAATRVGAARPFPAKLTVRSDGAGWDVIPCAHLAHSVLA